MSFLKINNLSVDYEMRRETVYAAKNVNIDVNRGEILGLVGESGSGKSTVGNAIINLIDEPGKVSNGSIVLDGINILEDPEIRVRLSEYSNWPTIPQLFVNGELIGGCDIVMEMDSKGELKDILIKAV